ncbi:hypothetical protein ABIE09_003226 [Lysobacter enzymogenes]|uniref:hypothetical protein n=1 Tax=Lysobacter enzymogenes TaxID=69 RepID=UPI00089D2A55|nr:hypothetical protein [Lysobacter enzymogenes]SDW67059.1 hypothetical protein SAMN05421681_102511 [Lysobacter enzymogenes]
MRDSAETGYPLLAKLGFHVLLIAMFVPMSAFAVWESFGGSRLAVWFVAGGLVPFCALLVLKRRAGTSPTALAGCKWLLLVLYAGVFGLNAYLFVSGCIWWGAVNAALSLAGLALGMGGVSLATRYPPRWGGTVASAMALLIVIVDTGVSMRVGGMVFFPFLFAPVMMIAALALAAAVWLDAGKGRDR